MVIINNFVVMVLMQDGFNNYTCVCKLGFSGKNCEINDDDCKPNPCKNGGFCKVNQGQYTAFFNSIVHNFFLY